MRVKQSEGEGDKELESSLTSTRSFGAAKIIDGEQRNGGAAWSSKLQQWRRRES
jgi:hypothetical protein